MEVLPILSMLILTQLYLIGVSIPTVKDIWKQAQTAVDDYIEIDLVNFENKEKSKTLSQK